MLVCSCICTGLVWSKSKAKQKQTVVNSDNGLREKQHTQKYAPGIAKQTNKQANKQKKQKQKQNKTKSKPKTKTKNKPMPYAYIFSFDFILIFYPHF